MEKRRLIRSDHFRFHFRPFMPSRIRCFCLADQFAFSALPLVPPPPPSAQCSGTHTVSPSPGSGTARPPRGPDSEGGPAKIRASWADRTDQTSRTWIGSVSAGTQAAQLWKLGFSFLERSRGMYSEAQVPWQNLQGTDWLGMQIRIWGFGPGFSVPSLPFSEHWSWSQISPCPRSWSVPLLIFDLWSFPALVPDLDLWSVPLPTLISDPVPFPLACSPHSSARTRALAVCTWTGLPCSCPPPSFCWLRQWSSTPKRQTDDDVGHLRRILLEGQWFRNTKIYAERTQRSNRTTLFGRKRRKWTKWARKVPFFPMSLPY